MDVEHIEPHTLRRRVHRDRERERVRGMVEERVGRHLDLVVVDPLLEVRQPERLGVGDEVHHVPAPGELDAEFGRDDARAAVDRIARDPDLQNPTSFQRPAISSTSSSLGLVPSTQTAS